MWYSDPSCFKRISTTWLKVIFYSLKEINNHKKDGFFSRKCIESGSTLTVSFWHPSEKVKKIKCKYCKQNVEESILRNKHMNKLKGNEEVSKDISDAIIVDFVNFAGTKFCII